MTGIVLSTFCTRNKTEELRINLRLTPKNLLSVAYDPEGEGNGFELNTVVDKHM
jgi:hypothetical protein